MHKPLPHSLDDLTARLAAEHDDLFWLSAGDGRLLATRHAARLMASDDGHADTWSNPFFVAEDGDTGQLTGGDRLWIAPEVGYFWPNLQQAREDPKKWAKTPPVMDPAHWTITNQSDNALALSTEMDLTDARDGKRIRLTADRSFQGLDRSADLDPGLRCVSFAITNTLTLIDGDAGAVAGAWDILMVPAEPTPGTLIIPTTREIELANINSYYDPFGDEHVVIDGQSVRFRCDGQRRVKMGLPADLTAGTMAHYRPTTDGQAILIHRTFPTHHEETYCDIPRSFPDDQRLGGDCFQAYNDEGDSFGPAIGGSPTFSEMEYHDPCLAVGTDKTTQTGTCTTHILTGPEALIREHLSTRLQLTP
ncbi:MAG: DUF6786 family protein [Planctomycetota bacterium]